MKKKKRTQKERVAKVQNFVRQNLIFTIISVILSILLLIGGISAANNPDNTTRSATEQEQSSDEEDTNEWRFYPIDFWILAIGGGFCSVMIIRERKKEREKLK